MVRAVRGAITAEENTKESILKSTKELLEKIILENKIERADLIQIIFTLTPDLNAVFPAVAAREMGITNVPLMCMSEIPVEGALKKCVRILLEMNSDKGLDDIKHIYLKGAKALRPDLADKD